MTGEQFAGEIFQQQQQLDFKTTIIAVLNERLKSGGNRHFTFKKVKTNGQCQPG